MSENFCQQLPETVKLIEISSILLSIVQDFLKRGIHQPTTEADQRLAGVIIDQIRQAKCYDRFLPWSQHSRLEPVLRQIQQQPASLITLQQCADMVGLSERHLLRLSQQELHMSLNEWRSRAKLLIAIDMLRQQHSINQIASYLGYHSASAFINMFQRMTGKTPTQLRAGQLKQLNSLHIKSLNLRLQNYILHNLIFNNIIVALPETPELVTTMYKPVLPENTFTDSKDMLLLDRQVCFPLYAASNLLNRLYRPVLAQFNLTYPQYLVMLVLWEQFPVSVGDLGDKLFLDSGTLTPLLKRLEANGLVNRQRDPADERRVLIHLSEQGAQLKQQAGVIPQTLASSLNLSVEQIDQLRTQVQQMVSVMSQALQHKD